MLLLRIARQWLLLLMLSGLALPAMAASIPMDNGKQVTYAFKSERLSDFLTRLAKDQGLRLVLSRALKRDKRTLNGRKTGTPLNIFNSIVQSNGLLAYFDKRQLHIYLASEADHKYVALPLSQQQQLQQSMKSMDMVDQHNYVKLYPATSMMEIHGAPRFLQQSDELAEAIKQNSVGADNFIFQYFPLKYAWASDRNFSAGDRTVTVPGVATLLKQLTGQHLESGFGFDQPGKTAADPSRVKDNLVGQPLSSAVFNQPEGQAITHISQGSDGASIVADPYRNAVIVKDTEANITRYAQLIAQLDVPTQIVEIEATIIDVNTTQLRELGTDWRFSGTDGDISFGTGNVQSSFINALNFNNTDLIEQIPGLQIGAIIGDGDKFIARLTALEKEGVLKVSSRPKVATLNDLEAVIEASQSLFVPVPGAYEVDLFEVFSGTVFRVTPHVIEDDHLNRIRLTISVQDGVVELSDNETMPVTTKNSVNTQAIVNEGHSLLLGGLVREVTEVSESKVPLLGNIPLLGNLFKKETRNKTSSERLFLISPRLLTPTGAYGSTKKLENSVAQQEPSATKACIGYCDNDFGTEHFKLF